MNRKRPRPALPARIQQKIGSETTPSPADGVWLRLLKLLLRLTLAIIALLVIALPVAGLYLLLQERQVGISPTSTTPSVAVGDGPQGMERTLLGLWLGLRDADVRRPAGSNPTPVKFFVYPGDSADEIARNLQAYGLITDADLFRQLVKYQGVGGSLQAGEYELRQTMTMEQIIAALQKSRPHETRVTIREGWRIEQIADMLSKNGISTYDDLLTAMRARTYTYSILSDKPAGVSLEGYLYPDTYHMDPRWSAEQVVDLLIATMDRRFTPAMRQQAAAQKLTIHQVLTIASLVERETVLASERPTVASVYLNRLQANMALEADATVQYALGFDKEQQRWWPNIQLDQLRSVQSPYNTYLRRDLPPGPICSPGMASIQAVLQPAKTEYLFYYAKGDGSHVFAKTFDEHLENQKKYQK